MFANTQMGGINFAFPDVCMTPSPAPVPIPYPNMAIASTAIPAQFKTLIMCMPAHNMGTTIPMSNGDNAGVAGGVASGMLMGPAKNVTGALSVLIGGMPATRMTSVSLQNSTNCPGATLVPSQTKVILLAP